MASRRFDYIIVGGGSSGCVVASRLVAEQGAKVLLVEAGPRKVSPILAMPAGYMKFIGRDTYLTMHHTVPQEQLDGRAPIIPHVALGVAVFTWNGMRVARVTSLRSMPPRAAGGDLKHNSSGWSGRATSPPPSWHSPG